MTVPPYSDSARYANRVLAHTRDGLRAQWDGVASSWANEVVFVSYALNAQVQSASCLQEIAIHWI